MRAALLSFVVRAPREEGKELVRHGDGDDEKSEEEWECGEN